MNGKKYPSIEHYFQAAKFDYPEASKKSKEYAEIIRKEKSAAKIKILSRQKKVGGYPSGPGRYPLKTALNPLIEKYQDVPLRPYWDTLCIGVMYLALLEKFKDPKLRKLLLSTGSKTIIEDSPFDYKWGVGKSGKGSNYLGKLLMDVRAVIRGEEKGVITYSYTRGPYFKPSGKTIMVKTKWVDEIPGEKEAKGDKIFFSCESNGYDVVIEVFTVTDFLIVFGVAWVHNSELVIEYIEDE